MTEDIDINTKLLIQLRSSVEELRARGLLKASTWTLEQIIGMNTNNNTTTAQYKRIDVYQDLPENKVDLLLLARSLLESEEYQRCAYLLQSKKVCSFLTNSSKGEKNADKLGLFLLSYARYMAGEKLRHQLSTEGPTIQPKDEEDPNNKKQKKNKMDTDATKNKQFISKNTNLQVLYQDLLVHYKQGRMENDGFLLYIFAVVVRDLHQQYGANVSEILRTLQQQNEQYEIDISSSSTTKENNSNTGVLSAKQLFLQSVRVYPWNW